MSSFRATRQPIAVAIVFASHRGLDADVDPDGSHANPGRAIARGWRAWLNSGALGRDDRAVMIEYDEELVQSVGDGKWARGDTALAGAEPMLHLRSERDGDEPRLSTRSPQRSAPARTTISSCRAGACCSS